MLAVAKMPDTNIYIRGAITARLVALLSKEGAVVTFLYDDGDDLLSAVETEWDKKTKARMNPGTVMRLHRTMKGMTQEQLGKKLGDVDRQNVSAMEKGTRPISPKMSHKLAEIFGVSYLKFV